MLGILKFILGLICFAALLYGAYYVTKLTVKLPLGHSKSKYMRIIDKLMFSKDESIAIVKVGDENLLIGISSKGISILKEIEQDKLLENVIENPNAENDIVANFIRKIIRSVKGFKRSKQVNSFNDILIKKIKLGKSDEYQD